MRQSYNIISTRKITVQLTAAQIITVIKKSGLNPKRTHPYARVLTHISTHKRVH